MTAEEKLKELYEEVAKAKEKEEEASKEILPKGTVRIARGTYPRVDYCGGISISVEHIDLIANLVVERMREESCRDCMGMA